MKLRSLVGLGVFVGGVAAAGVGCNGHTALGEDGAAGSGDSDDSGTAGKPTHDQNGNDTGGYLATGGTLDYGTAGTSYGAEGPNYGGYSFTAGTDYGGNSFTSGTSYGGNFTAGSYSGPPATLELTKPAACPTTCADAATSLYNLSTLEDFYSHLVGRWLICSGGANTFQKPADAIGVEYAAPTLVDSPYGGKVWQGNMYYLVDGQDGPERGKGLQYLLTYDVSPQDGGFLSRLNMHSAPTAVIPAMFKYSACPRQWLITGEAAQDAGALLVPIE